MRIAGIDPGLCITGYGIVEKKAHQLHLIDAGTIRNPVSFPLEKRLKRLFENVDILFKDHKPDVVVVEEIYSNYKYPYTAVLMGHARGIIYLASAVNSIPVHSFKPTHVKKAATGNGHASKEQIAGAICSIFGIKRFKGFFDVTDALALTVAYEHRVR
ncbi:hypothetical protein B9J78_00265 [bacterium Unc6]|nr:hypothetical protein [bacterium Unc6]